MSWLAVLVACGEYRLAEHPDETASTGESAWEPHPAAPLSGPALLGTATKGEGGGTELVRAPDEVGAAAWDVVPLHSSAMHVDIEFTVEITAGRGADGFALTLLDAARIGAGPWMGEGGGCLGYGAREGDEECSGGGGALPGWTVELDAYQNEWDDLASDHVGVVLDGDETDTTHQAAVPFPVRDGLPHLLSVRSTDGAVTVAIDGRPLLDAPLGSALGFYGYLVATASTGTAAHRVVVGPPMVYWIPRGDTGAP